jgi:hypothetical protein
MTSNEYRVVGRRRYLRLLEMRSQAPTRQETKITDKRRTACPPITDAKAL